MACKCNREEQTSIFIAHHQEVCHCMYKCFVCQQEGEKKKARKKQRWINKGHNRDSFTAAQTWCLRGVREERLRGRRCNYMTALPMGGEFHLSNHLLLSCIPAGLNAHAQLPLRHLSLLLHPSITHHCTTWRNTPPALFLQCSHFNCNFRTSD